MELTTENVHVILIKCLFEEGEDTSSHIIANGVHLRVGFHPERLASHKVDIESMADQLPDEFKKSGGGGASFLNACMTASGKQWGEHADVDKLLCLGIASGKITLLLPLELCQALPGGLPYFVVN